MSYLLEGSRESALSTSHVYGGGCYALNRPSSDEALLNGLPIDNGGGFKDVFRQVKRVSYLRDLGQGKGEVSLRGIGDSDATLPLSKPIDLGFLAGTEPLTVDVAVMPVNHGRKPFVVDGERHGGADTGSFLPLFNVERTPLRSSVREFGGDDEPAVHTHDFGALVVPHESAAPALWAVLNLCGL